MGFSFGGLTAAKFRGCADPAEPGSDIAIFVPKAIW